MSQGAPVAIGVVRDRRQHNGRLPRRTLLAPLHRRGRPADDGDAAQEVVAALDGEFALRRNDQVADARRVVDAFEAIDDRPANQRHAAGVGRDFRIGLDAPRGRVERQLDRVSGRPAAVQAGVAADDFQVFDRLAVHFHPRRALGRPADDLVEVVGRRFALAPTGNAQTQIELGGLLGIDSDFDIALPRIARGLPQPDRAARPLDFRAAADEELKLTKRGSPARQFSALREIGGAFSGAIADD